MLRHTIRLDSRDVSDGYPMTAWRGCALGVLSCLLALYSPSSLTAEPLQTPRGPQHGIAMHGKPALPKTFTHLPYANPAAPKGGKVTLGYFGTFDTLNPYNLKAGSAAQGISGYVYQPLMMRSSDEAFTLYGLIAQSIETSATRDRVTFRLNPKARFSDGKPVTSADVRFSLELLRKQGRPQHRVVYSQIKSIETPDPYTVHYDLSGSNDRELLLILALMPVLPAHATNVKTFAEASYEPPVGSGPYMVTDVKAGEYIRLVRNKNYWARDLPVHRGLYNFDNIKIEYFRDSATLFQALKAGLVDYREEGDPTRWRTGYDFPALRAGRIIRKSLPLGGAKGMSGYAFNIRRDVFKDVRVREALAMTFDFEWVNAKIYGGLYKRTKSFFDNSPLSAAHRPASDAEKALLAQWPDSVRKDIMDGTWRIPVHTGSGRDRELAREALKLLDQAGYTLRNGALYHRTTSRPLKFEILVLSREQERLALIYARALRRIGVVANVRQNALVEYQRKRQKFDFDMIMGWWIASNSPGNEQHNRWSSRAASIESSHNLAGVRSPAVDQLIKVIVGARSKQDFVTAVRAFDRVLLSGFYVVPHFHKSEQWFSYSSALAYPAQLPRFATPLFGELLDTWWRIQP